MKQEFKNPTSALERLCDIINLIFFFKHIENSEWIQVVRNYSLPESLPIDQMIQIKSDNQCSGITNACKYICGM